MPSRNNVKFKNSIKNNFLLLFSITLMLNDYDVAAENSRDGDQAFLTTIDFLNARFVDTSKPLKQVINDQRFPTNRGSVVSLDTDKWPSGRIPYVLSSAYTSAQRAVLARAISAYNAKTCIRFVPKTAADKDYVSISKLDGCYADFARVGGRQQISLADECIDYATIIHEFMHVIGFIHEHQREDRDGFVKIVWENVIEGIII